MYKSKLVEILKQIDTIESGELKKFLLSPLHNRREDVVKLFMALKSCKRFDKKELEQKRIFGLVYPNQIFDEKKLRYTRSYLHKLIEQFFTYKEFKQDSIQQQLYLAQAYRQRNFSTAFQHTTKTAKTSHNKQPLRHAEYHYWQYQLHVERYQHIKNQRRTTEMNLQPLSDSFDVFCMANKLRQSCMLLAHQPFYNKDYNFGLLDSMLSYIEQEKYLDIPAIGVYYYGYKALTEEKESYFKILKQYLAKYGEQFPANELREIYLLTINIGIKRLNKGHRAYVREIFELYKEALERNALFEHGILSQWTYKNIVAIGLGLKEFEWVEQFIKSHKQFLEKKHQEGSYSYNLAKLYYELKEYKKAMLLLVNVRYDDLVPNLTSKALLVKIYYESDEIEALNSLLHSFEVLLHRQKNMGYHKENYLNFVRFTKKLLILNPYDKAEKQALIEAIKEVKVLTEKRWLLGILE